MSTVDISALRMDEESRDRPPPRPLGPRIAIVALLLGALGLAATFLVPLLAPVRAVRTAPVRALAEAGLSRTSIAEAAGWVEPDPYPVIVRPLVDGVLDELFVLEGHKVKRGETVIARLESADLLAARDRAAARFVLREVEVRRAEVKHAVALSLLEQRAPLRTAEKSARHELAAVHGRVASSRGALAAAQADRDARRAELDAQEKLQEAGGTYPVALARARALLRAAEAGIVAETGRLNALRAEEVEGEALLAIAVEVVKDPRALAGAESTAQMDVLKARADRDAAKVELEIAERELAWAEIRAPADGVVMKLLASPGAEVGPTGKGVVALYDPAKLQARIDVPLNSMEGIVAGQEVEIRSEVLGPRATRGVVDRIQRESDLLKNTLQVKVRLLDPDPLLRPETLCRARFLATGGDAKRGPALFRVPRDAVRGGAVFVLDPRGHARRVIVERVGESGEAVVVKGGLSVTHRVILDSVEEGERVKEDRP